MVRSFYRPFTIISRFMGRVSVQPLPEPTRPDTIQNVSVLRLGSAWPGLFGASATALLLNFVVCTQALRAAGSGASNEAFDIWQAGGDWQLNAVTTILQSHDGYLWLGTYQGLRKMYGDR